MFTRNYRENSEEFRREANEDLSLQELSEKYRGVKTLEWMVRRSYESQLPEELRPEKLGVGSKLEEYDDNGMSRGYDSWEIAIPLEENDVEASLPAIIAEEIGHNIHDGVACSRLQREKWGVYREAVAAYFREQVFDDNIRAVVQKRRSKLSEVENLYDPERIAGEIQEHLPEVSRLIDEVESELDSGGDPDRLYGDRVRTLVKDSGWSQIDLPGRGEKAYVPNPVERYVRNKAPIMDLNSDSTPRSIEDVRQDVARDLEVGVSRFVERNTDFIADLESDAKNEVFDLQHDVGRELYLRVKQSNQHRAEDLVRMESEPLESLIDPMIDEIATEYGFTIEE